MNFYDKYVRQLSFRIISALILNGAISVGALWAGLHYFPDSQLSVFLASAVVYLVGLLLARNWIMKSSTEPVRYLWEAVQFISPSTSGAASPDINKARIGKEMISSMIMQIYQLASTVSEVEKERKLQTRDIHGSFVANSLPLPLIVANPDDTIVYANEAAANYLEITAADLTGQSLYTALNMSFSDENTFEKWVSSARQKSATANQLWERVRIGLPGQKDSKQFDLAAHYNRGNTMGYETMLVLFDHNEIYSQDDQAMGFVAITVHELRTPLTLLRGYIEVFQEELGPSLNPEMKDFMSKMGAAAEQLTAFVNNILNVAKIDDNQLTLQLQEDDWSDILATAVNDIGLRAKVRGITIKTDIAADLPPVAVDRYSIYEVIANLLDNAVKYSTSANEVYLSAKVNEHGQIETSIKDFGLGIEPNVLPHIFDKYYRNHRNRAQVGGTGLGLFLAKAIVKAHGGEISVRSKVDQGSTFSFTIQPFSAVKDEIANSGQSTIARGAHGWIKNHSLYRG